MKASFLAIALAVLPSLCCAEASLKSQMKAFNKVIDSDFMHRDMDAFAKHCKGSMTADFQYSEEGGKTMDYNSMVAGMKQAFTMYQKLTKVSTTVVSVTEMGDTAKAVEKHTMEGLIGGPDKKTHKMAYVGTSDEVYKKVKGKWLMASMTMKTDKMTMDGKPMAMQGGH